MLARGARGVPEETQYDDPPEKGAVGAYETKALQCPSFRVVGAMCSNRHGGEARKAR